MKIETNYIIAASYLPDSNMRKTSVKEINHEIENNEMKEFFKEEEQKVQPIYNSQGKVISHNNYERKVDMAV